MFFAADVHGVSNFAGSCKESGEVAFTAHERHSHKADLGNVAVLKVTLKRTLASHQIVVAHRCFACHEFGFNFDDVAVCSDDEGDLFPFGNRGQTLSKSEPGAKVAEPSGRR